MIHSLKKAYPIASMCALVGVARSSYYAWKARQGKARPVRMGLMREVQAIHAQMRQSYGSRRYRRK